MAASIKEIWYTPAFSSVLSNRTEVMMIAGLSTLHLGLGYLGLPGWVCPIRTATGIPCPGCGLTTAMIQFTQGSFAESFQTHAFAPIFLVVVFIILLVLVASEPLRSNIIERVRIFELRNGVTTWVLFTLMFYWVLRLVA